MDCHALCKYFFGIFRKIVRFTFESMLLAPNRRFARPPLGFLHNRSKLNRSNAVDIDKRLITGILHIVQRLWRYV